MEVYLTGSELESVLVRLQWDFTSDPAWPEGKERIKTFGIYEKLYPLFKQIEEDTILVLKEVENDAKRR